MCRIKKITPRTEQTFWDRQLCFYVKKLFVSEKTRKSELFHFSKEIYVTNFAAGALELMHLGQNVWHKSPLKKFVQYMVLFFWFDIFEGMSFFQQYILAKREVLGFS